jgi:hypothetical protein
MPALSVSAPHGKVYREGGRLRRSACVSGPSSALCDALSTAVLVVGDGLRGRLQERFPSYRGWRA